MLMHACVQSKGIRAHAGQPELAIVNMRGDEITSDVLPINGFERYVVSYHTSNPPAMTHFCSK